MTCNCNVDMLHHEITYLRSELVRRDTETTEMRELVRRLVAGEALTVDELGVLADDRMAHHTAVLAQLLKVVVA